LGFHNIFYSCYFRFGLLAVINPKGGGARSSRLTPGYRALAPTGLFKEYISLILGAARHNC
jgi:hypothetical protein